ncbi:MAG: hypothetical protein ACPG9K_07630, partial [Poseidonibacter sp.]
TFESILFRSCPSPHPTSNIFLPAIFFVALASVFTAPLGVKLAHKMSSKLLKKIFSLIPFFLSIKLIYELV